MKNPSKKSKKENKATFRILKSTFKKVIKQNCAVRLKSEWNSLCGIKFEYENEVLTIASTDGNRLLVNEIIVDDIVQPEVWQYLSPKMAGQLRRWVNQFIKANQEESEKLAIPFMNKKLRQRIREIDLKLKAQQIKKMIDAKKAEKAKAVSDEN